MSFLNGLSAMGQGVAAFAGTAGLEAQRSALAQQSLVLADQLATTRETGLQQSAGAIAATAAGKQQVFETGLHASDAAAALARTQLTEGGSNTRNAATIAAELQRSKDTEAGATQRVQMGIDAPTPEIKSARQFATLSPTERQAYREEMMTKAGLPAWMIGGGDTPSPPAGSGAVLDNPTITPDAGSASSGTQTATPSVTGAPTTAAPTVADPGATRNEKALDGVPGAPASIIKGMVDGRISPPSSFAMSKPYWQGLVAKAAEYDPTFDQTTWAGRVATKKDFAAGTSAKAVTALNTALGHAGVVSDAMTALNNGPIPWGNAAENWIDENIGDARPGNARQAVDALASEARKVFSGSGGGNLSELQEWQKNFPLNGSPSQQQGALKQFVNLLDSRLQSLSDQYNRGMGRTDDPVALLQPHAKEVYERLTGRDPSDATGYQTGKPPAGGAAASAPAASTTTAPADWKGAPDGTPFKQGGVTYIKQGSDPSQWKVAP
jgi:hypothetical protein